MSTKPPQRARDECRVLISHFNKGKLVESSYGSSILNSTLTLFTKDCRLSASPNVGSLKSSVMSPSAVGFVDFK